MSDDTAVDVPTGTVPEPTVTPPPEPPHPEPAPPVTPAPAPDPNLDAFARMDAEHVGQIAGARKALLASSLTQAVETKPEHQTQVVTLADKLRLPADVVEKRYDELSRQVQLQSIDYSRVMLHHPEVASWLTVPENAKIAHDDVPALTALSGALKVASGQVAAEDITGLLPPGYVFQRDGSIRGPLRDGQATMYPSLEALQGTFARQATAQWIVQSRYEQEHGAGFLASVGAGARQSVASTLAALAAMGGGDTSDRRAVLRQSEADLGEAARLDPGLVGSAGRLLGQLGTDAPLYVVGGEIAGLGRLGRLLGDSAVGAGAEGYRARVAVEDALRAWERSGDKRQVERLLQAGLAPTQPAAAQRLATSARLLAQGGELAPDPLSSYLVDAFKTAVAYAPAAARSGINQGAEHGTGYGVADFLINDLLPATGGSKLGLAKAIVPGEETAAAGGGFAGLAGRLLLHSGAQAGLMGATEFGNAIHEYVTGVNPDALSWDQLAPRLAQAGALGGLMAGAFHLAPEIGHLTYRRKIAANAALTDADHLGYAVEQAIGSKAVERVPARAEQMMQAVTAGGPARTRYLQGDDFLEVAKAAKITPEELASKLQIETQWEEAKRLGKTMSLSLDQLTARLSEMHEQPEAIKAAIERVRSTPDGWNVAEALHFYQASPTEIDKQLEAMRADVGKAARDMSEADPIYQDLLGKLVDAGEDPQVARDNARLTAALFNHRVARFNRGAAERGATLLDPLAEYQTYQLQVRRGELGDATAGTRLEQPSGSKNAPRGAIEFGAERHFLMTLTGRADLSTVLHESGHFWLEVMGDFAERADAPQEFKDDYAKALTFLGAKDRASIGVEHHEKWARAVEQYLMEGHAPSPELRPVFQRFLVWLTDLYRSVKRLVKLTPEVKGVFDRLLASDEAIREAQTELNTSTLYPTREHWGGNDESWQAYQAAIGRARDSAQANVFSQAMAVLRRQKSKTWKEEYAGAVGEAEALIRARPIRIAEEALVKGRGRDGKDLAQPVKLDRLEIRDTYGPEALARIPRGATGIADPGSATRVLSLAQAAELFEISSGKDLLDQLSSLPKRMAEIHELAKGIMEARHPDLTPEAMRQAAMDAVHANDAHADVLNREAASLAVKADRQHIPREQIRQLAERIIGETQIDSINPKLHLREQMTASKDATEALLKAKPDYTAALLAKQREQLAHELYRAAAAAAERIDKCDTLMRDSRKKKAQEMLGRADAHTGGTGWYVDGGDGMPLPAMDQKTAEAIAEETGGEAKQGQTYRDAMNALSSFWLDDKAKRLDLRMAQVDSLYRQAQATMFRARDAFSIRKGEEQANLDELVAAGMAAANTDKAGNAKPPLRPGRRDRGPWDWFKTGASRGFAFLRDMPHVVRLMDNDTTGGWFWEHIARPLNHAADDEQRRQFENAQLLSEAYRDYQQTEGKSRLMAHDTFIPEIGRSLNLEARLAVLANAGSTKNLRRLMDGEGWSRQQITAIIATLDKADIGFVKRLWLLANKDWESTKETHRRLFGVTPEKRDSLLVETAHGTIEGAYYPIHYDQDRTARRQDISLEREKEALRSMPNAGFTMQTVERTNRPLLLTMDVIPRHLNTVAHWLSHVEPIDGLNKLLGDERLWSTMVERFGKDEADVVRDTVREVARGQRGARNWLEKSIRFLRTRSGMATMGFNVMSAASQPFGLTQSMERVGVGAYIHAQARIMQGHESMESWGAFVRSKSGMMTRRGENLIAETAERQGRSAVGGVTGWLQDHSYTLMNKAQWLVDLPTWVAEYEKQQKLHPDDDRRCVDLADQAVLDTQGSGLAKDISAAQRNEIGKLLMQFGGFFNKTYNEAYNRLATNAHLAGGWAPLPNDVESLGRLAWSYLLLVGLPSVAMSIFKQAVRPDPKDDGSVSWWAKRLAKDHAGYLLSTVIFGRELSGALDGFDYNGPAGMRSVALSSQLLKQVMRVDVTTGEGINARLGKAAVLTAASLTGLPGNQAWRTLSGLMQAIENRSANPLPLLFGPPPTH